MQELSRTLEKMSSKRIAEKTGKRHDNIVRDIKTMLDALQEDSSNLRNDEYEIVTDNRGFTSEILLNERLSLCLGTGYSIPLRMAIIDDWAEMKANQQTGILSREQKIAEALMLTQEIIAEKDAEIKQLKPKAEFTEIVLKSATCHTVTEIAKELGMTAIELNKRLCERGIQFKHRDNYVLYAQYSKRGYTDTETVPYIGANGEMLTRIQTVWTEYGRVFIHSLFNEGLSFSKVQKVA